ncbi:STAS-like domain-containing protein [bacterium]|nr:STAS-like domain-containing protein [bacterium]MBU1753983.1 STAS-like domain-containing protein [bacterium]
MKEIKVNIFEQIGSSAAVSSEDGELLYNRIAKGLKEKEVKVILDFINIELITSTFLNAAIGQLYNEYDSPFLRERLKVENMTGEDLELLKKVVERAKEYFKNKATMDASIKEALGDE